MWNTFARGLHSNNKNPALPREVVPGNLVAIQAYGFNLAA